MKKLTIALAFAVVLVACGSQKTLLQSGKYNLQSECPANGDCTFVVAKDSSMTLVEDGVGKMRYNMTSHEGKSILTYKYNKKSDPRAQDDFYSEEVIIETNSDIASLNKDSEIKMLFGVFCYCKGVAGYYEAKDGYAEYRDGKVIITIPKVIENQKTNIIIADIK